MRASLSGERQRLGDPGVHGIDLLDRNATRLALPQWGRIKGGEAACFCALSSQHLSRISDLLPRLDKFCELTVAGRRCKTARKFAREATIISAETIPLDPELRDILENLASGATEANL